MIIKKNYWSIARRLTTAQLQKEKDGGYYLDEADLFNVNIGNRGNSFFLGYYSKEGLDLVFDKYDVYHDLRKKGFAKPFLDLDTSDAFVHKLAIYDAKKSPDHLLMEVVLRRQLTPIDMPFYSPLNGQKYETLAIEWMCLQNPRKKFSKERPRLPGQAYPGLGLASKAVELLMITAWRLNLAGLLNTPQHYHNAVLYSRIFYYIEPQYQAMLKAMQRDLKRFPLYMIAWAIEWGAVRHVDSGKILQWPAVKQMVPLNAKLKELFTSKGYRSFVREEAKNYHFELDENKYKLMKEKHKEKL
jgi:hypothetical protein